MGKVGYRRQGRGKKTAIAVICITAAVIIGLVCIFALMPELEKSQYRLEYEDLIERYAGEYGLDPDFVAAIIHTESGFDPEAGSGAGAMGLMQIMPETGEWIAGKLGSEGFTANDLLDPETNIEMGCWYLQFLQERFDSLPVIMAAYNAGHNRVMEWLDDPQYSDGTNLTNIPYEETDHYVKKVTKAYEKYKELYELG